jgi:hypothetical protein
VISEPEVPMPRLYRPAHLAAATALAAGVLAGPGAAYAADTSTPLTAAQMATALKAVAATSATAAADGWQATVSLTGGTASGSEEFVVDPVAKVTFVRLRFAGLAVSEYDAAGRGVYTYLSDPASRAAVTMMGRPAVRYSYKADRSVKLDRFGVSPAALFTDADIRHAGTRTVHDDGSADYRLVDEDDTAVTLHVQAAGVLSSAHATGDGLDMTLAYTYRAQHVTLPSGATTISAAALAAGMTYRTMPAYVKQVAYGSAADTRRAAHGHRVALSSLRKVVRTDAADFNRAMAVTMIKVRNVRGGVRLYATNPWTHASVAYTVTASGAKVVVTKK